MALALAQVQSLLDYDPDTGIFTWKIDIPSRVRAGDRAGTLTTGPDKGYRYIKINQRRYKASHLAWFLMTGAWPTKLIDHWNRIRDDDRWLNLREVTPVESNMNRDLPPRTGALNVHSHKQSGRWRVRFQCGGKHIAKMFATREAAVVFAETLPNREWLTDGP